MKDRQIQIEGWGHEIQIWGRGRQIQIRAGCRETQILKKLRFSKLQLSKFKQFVIRSVFGELQLTQISLNLKLLVAT